MYNSILINPHQKNAEKLITFHSMSKDEEKNSNFSPGIVLSRCKKLAGKNSPKKLISFAQFPRKIGNNNFFSKNNFCSKCLRYTKNALLRILPKFLRQKTENF